jgi:hypothetical protein
MEKFSGARIEGGETDKQKEARLANGNLLVNQDLSADEQSNLIKKIVDGKDAGWAYWALLDVAKASIEQRGSLKNVILNSGSSYWSYFAARYIDDFSEDERANCSPLLRVLLKIYERLLIHPTLSA